MTDNEALKAALDVLGCEVAARLGPRPTISEPYREMFATLGRALDEAERERAGLTREVRAWRAFDGACRVGYTGPANRARGEMEQARAANERDGFPSGGTDAER